MRPAGFLRTPIRGDHQNRLKHLLIREAALAGDPRPADPYPQALEITFDVEPGVTEVQIAPLWEGSLEFIPDSQLNNPTDPAQVTAANYPTWSVTGDLVLRAFKTFVAGSSLGEPFRNHIPLITPAPDTVHYSKIRLTQDFLFTTLGQLYPHRFVFNKAPVARDDPLYLPKLVIAFLKGHTLVNCRLDPADPTKDDALRSMPIVRLAAPGTPTVLRVTVATLVSEVRVKDWFNQRPEYDDISGEQLVDPALRNFEDQNYNPSHAGHSVIPAWALFQAAAPAAFAPDHGAATPLRVALKAPRPDGLTYRRIDLMRPPIPGAAVSSNPQRPYPMYQLCWRPVAGGVPRSLRIPLSGRLYLPLADGPHVFWAIPRSQDPTMVLVGAQVQMSLGPVAPAKFIGPPQATVHVDLTGAPTATIYAHLQEYDSKFVWQAFRDVQPRRAGLKHAAEVDWNVDVHDWFLLPTTPARAPFAAVYGFIRESAGRHNLAPEFLQAVFMGEGGNVALESRAAFVPGEALLAFGFLGLDLILYRTGRLPAGSAPFPPEIPPGDPLEEIPEYSFNLVANGYTDAATAMAVSWDRTGVRHEAGGDRTLDIATIAGWSAAVELVAAELHARLDQMVAYCAGQAPAIPTGDENRRRYLSYVRFNNTLRTAKQHADDLANRVKKAPATWVASPPPELPPSGDRQRFNALQRLAVAQWQEAAQVYR